MSAHVLRGVITPASLGVMTRNPADDEYMALCKRLEGLQREAGAFLARSLRSDTEKPAISRAMAEDFAREAIQVDDAMKAWRLANGYEK